MRPTKLVSRSIIVLTAYDAATNQSDDVEAGLKSDDVTVTTSSPAAAAEADNAFSDKAVRRAFIKKVVVAIDQYNANKIIFCSVQLCKRKG